MLLCAEFHRQIQDGGIVGVYKEAEDAERPDAASVRNLRSLRHDQVSFLEWKFKQEGLSVEGQLPAFQHTFWGGGGGGEVPCMVRWTNFDMSWGPCMVRKGGLGHVLSLCDEVQVGGWDLRRRSPWDLWLNNFYMGNCQMGRQPQCGCTT